MYLAIEVFNHIKLKYVKQIFTLLSRGGCDPTFEGEYPATHKQYCYWVYYATHECTQQH